jgi:Undecaprenyl-phosphate galactose phosphotransferase WbaP
VQEFVEQYLGEYSHVCVAGDDVRLPASLEDGVSGRAYENRILNPIAMLTKRMLDVAAAVCAAVLCSPLLLALGVWTYISSPGPIFFGHERIGKDGRRFKVWKFRTMVTNAQEILEQHLAENPAAQAEWDATYKLQNDPRITTVGHLLRKTSLDELPQLLNVIKGEMSLVGPRPIVTGEIDRYADTYETYLRVRPGITGFWQVSGRNLTTYDRRVELDRFYVRNWSIWFDLYVLGRTIKTVVCREGAF